MLKKIMAVAAALLMAAGTGCSSKDEKTKEMSADVAKGRYIEENIETENIGGAGEFANSEEPKFTCTDYSEGDAVEKIYTLENNSFRSEELTAKLPEGMDTMYEPVLSPNGEVFGGVLGEDGNMRYLLINKAGEIKELELPEDTILFSSEFSADGRLFAVNDSGELVEINTETMEVTKLCSFDANPDRIDIVGDRIYCSNENSVSVYDLKAGKTDETDSALSDCWKMAITESSSSHYDVFAGNDNDLYVVCQNGIYRHSIGGSISEQIVDGLRYSLGGDDNFIMYGTVDKDGSIIVNFSDGSAKRYRYDPEVVNEFTSELNIFALEKNATLSRAVRTFAKTHPEVKLDLTIGMKDGMTCEDAVKNLTAEIMSGHAPDVILLDGLDTENFEDKGMLLDLSDIREKWQPDDELFTNIAEYNNDGGLYSVACRYAIPVVMGKKDQLDKIDSFDTLTKKAIESYNEKGGVSNKSEYQPESYSNEYIGLITQLYGNKMIKDGIPDESVIKSLLESMKELISKPCRGVFDFEESYSENVAVFDGANVATGLMDYAADMCYSVEALDYVTSVRDERDDADTMIGLPDNPNIFRPVCELGICASGGNRDAAAEFIKTALSNEVQNSDSGDGLPVNCESLEKLFADYDESSYCMQGMVMDDKGAERTYTIQNADDEEKAAITAYIRGADTAVRNDLVTESEIAETGVSCLNGDITAKEAAEQIKSKLELKMKE